MGVVAARGVSGKKQGITNAYQQQIVARVQWTEVLRGVVDEIIERVMHFAKHEREIGEQVRFQKIFPVHLVIPVDVHVRDAQLETQRFEKPRRVVQLQHERVPAR